MTTCPKHPDCNLLEGTMEGVQRLFCPRCYDFVIPEVSDKVLREKYRRNRQRKFDSSPGLSEADVKRTVDALCEFAQNQQKGIYVRLFTGDLLMRDETGRVISRVRGCAPGTPDRLWIALRRVLGRAFVGVTWLELKRPKNGRQSPEQKEFQAMAEAQGCFYLLVTDVSQVQEIIG